MEPPRPRFAAPRRASTAPDGRPPPPSSSTQGSVETLYNHPNVKIIAFTATARSIPRDSTDEDQGTLSWSSQLERTIAVGTSPSPLPPRGPVSSPNPGFKGELRVLTPARLLQDLSRPRLRRLPELRLRPPAHPPQEPVLVHRGGLEQVRPADPPPAVLAHRAARR